MHYFFSRDEVEFLLEFYGWLRRSEIIARNIGDVDFKTIPDGTEYVKLSIRDTTNNQRQKQPTACLSALGRHGVPI